MSRGTWKNNIRKRQVRLGEARFPHSQECRNVIIDFDLLAHGKCYRAVGWMDDFEGMGGARST